MSAGVGRQRRRLDYWRLFVHVEWRYVFPLFVVGGHLLGRRLGFVLGVVLLHVLRHFPRLLWLWLWFGHRLWLGRRLRGLPLCHLTGVTLDGLVADFLGLVGYRL